MNSGYYAAPTIFTGNNKMRIFQEEIFARSWRSCTSPDYDDAIGIANDTLHGLGAGLWTHDGNTAYRAGPRGAGLLRLGRDPPDCGDGTSRRHQVSVGCRLGQSGLVTLPGRCDRIG
jgi:hypothetical protein